VRSWIFRNRARLAALLGRPPVVGNPERPRRPAQGPRVVELVPVRRA